MHYALLDIVPTTATPTTSAASASAVELQLRVVSHAQEVVIYKEIPLRSKQSLLLMHSGEASSDGSAEVVSLEARAAKLKQALLLPPTAEEGDLQLDCVPYWGVPPLWRVVMHRAIIALCLLTFIVLPTLGVLWLVFASVYYICIGSELARREELERRYQRMKKQA